MGIDWTKYVLVIVRCRVQYEKYFSSSFCFLNIARAKAKCNITETKRTRKIFPYCPLNRTITSQCIIKTRNSSLGHTLIQYLLKICKTRFLSIDNALISATEERFSFLSLLTFKLIKKK